MRDALIAGLGADRVVDKPREGMGDARLIDQALVTLKRAAA